MTIYEPREDSFLIKKHILKYIKKDDNVLDIGAGSGILAKEALKKTKNVLAADINKKAIDHCKNQSISAIQSDLFSNIKGKFNLIIFNPPYLPENKNEPKDSQLQTTAGKKGYELIKKFLEQAKSHLEPKGKILLLFSSLSKKEIMDKILENNSYSYRLLEEKSFFFERLYVYLIKKNQL